MILFAIVPYYQNILTRPKLETNGMRQTILHIDVKIYNDFFQKPEFVF